jgi:hypothetical protein
MRRTVPPDTGFEQTLCTPCWHDQVLGRPIWRSRRPRSRATGYVCGPLKRVSGAAIFSPPGRLELAASVNCPRSLKAALGKALDSKGGLPARLRTHTRGH